MACHLACQLAELFPRRRVFPGNLGADILPDKLQRNRPSFGITQQVFDFIVLQLQAVALLKQHGDFSGVEGQRRLVEQKHFPFSAPVVQGRQADRRAPG